MSLVFYNQKDGTKPAGKFINSLNSDLKAKVVRDLDLLDKQELEKALGYMNDYLERREKDEYFYVVCKKSKQIRY